MPWPKGKKRSEETKRKMKTAHQRRLENPEAHKQMEANFAKSPSRSGYFSEDRRTSLSNAAMGKPKSKEHRRRLAEANKNKKHSVETRLKMSHTHKRLGTGKWAKGRKQPKEERATRSEAQKTRYARLGEREKQTKCIQKMWAERGGKHLPETVEKMKEVRSRQVMPLKDTKPERMAQAFLRSIGIEYETHKIIPGLERHQWDLVLERQKILIEIDGCYWHGCACLGKELTETQKKQQRKDRRRTRRAESKGWRVIRIWEHEVLDGLAGTCVAGLSGA